MGHSWRCGGLKQPLECLLARRLLLYERLEAKLLLIVQAEEHLVLGLVEDGKGLDDLIKWGGFHGSGGVFHNPGCQHHCRILV